MPRFKNSAEKSAKKEERWSARVTHESNALTLDAGVFTWKDPARIAASLKASSHHHAT